MDIFASAHPASFTVVCRHGIPLDRPAHAHCTHRQYKASGVRNHCPGLPPPLQTPASRFASSPGNPIMHACGMKVLGDFTRAHPQISVVRELAPHSSTAYHDLLTQKLKNRDATVDVFYRRDLGPGVCRGRVAHRSTINFLHATRLSACRRRGRPVRPITTVSLSRIDAGLLYFSPGPCSKNTVAAPTTWRNSSTRQKPSWRANSEQTRCFRLLGAIQAIQVWSVTCWNLSRAWRKPVATGWDQRPSRRP